MQNSFYGTEAKKSSAPTLLLVFDNGLERLPTVVPNGGSAEADEELMAWAEQRVLAQPSPREKQAA